MKEKVALIKGNSRYENILKALKYIEKEMKKKLRKEKVIIKPNCVSDSVQLASTHVDAIRAVLDFLNSIKIKKVTIAEGSAYNTKKAFHNFNYFSLKNKYDVEFFNLNNDDFEEIEIYSRNGRKLKVGISKTILQASKKNSLISLALLKTHDSAIATFSIKNVAVGSLIKKTFLKYRIPIPFIRRIANRILTIRNDKAKVHQGPKAINKNIFEIYKHVKPTLSIIDGFVAMEGNGPIDGEPVKMNLALAGTNALATDIVASNLIGLSPEKIGYIYYAMKHEKLEQGDIKIVGNTTIKKEKRKFKLHRNYKQQLLWKY